MTGLIIGRFQPFHNGHSYLIKKSLEHCDKLIIGIGSSNINNINNPLSFDVRKKIIEKYLKKEKLENKIIKIVALPDNPDDNIWLKNVLKIIGQVDAVISNNELEVNQFFDKAGYKIIRVPFYKRYILEGQKIRKLINDGKRWENRVPEYLVEDIKKDIEKFSIFK